ncbi:MAG: putative glycoside hydrolase [bacterium]|nr:putative glycoside hydrolase [bacterium]
MSKAVLFALLFFSVIIAGGFSLASLKSAYFAGPLVYNLADVSSDGTATQRLATSAAGRPHLKTPESVKAIYMTSWVAGTKNWREDLVKMIDDTELNAIIIDVKDYTGRISFKVFDPVLQKIGAEEERIPDIREFISELHRKNIYAIARISVFQDPYLVKQRPDLAVKRKSGGVWKDRKGIPWLDPANKETWEYVARIGKEAERAGFDELNFDYIRFPSDGNMTDISYDFWDEVTPRHIVLKNFFAYLRQELGGLNVALSADLFGLTTWNYDDLNIGQVLEDAALYFDFIAPMVYPSHYPPTFQGYANPASHPYEIINSAMKRASERLVTATSSPNKLRPWLQDFDMGATYTSEMIRKEKQAVYDAGLNSWMLWDPTNKYTREALDATPAP